MVLFFVAVPLAARVWTRCMWFLRRFTHRRVSSEENQVGCVGVWSMFGCGLVHTRGRMLSTARHHQLSSFVCRESHCALIEFHI